MKAIRPALWLILLAMSVHSAPAHTPTGWTYFRWPYAFASNTQDWHVFKSTDRQWCSDLSTGAWRLMGNSALSSGWVYWRWPYAYSSATRRWYFLAQNNTQWCLNLTSGQWRRLGDESGGLPAGKVLYINGYNDSGSPAILMKVYMILSATVLREIRTYLDPLDHTYSLTSLGGSKVRLRVHQEQDGGPGDNDREIPPDDETTFDLTFSTSTSGLVRNAFAIEYSNGILIDRWGMRDGTFNLQ
jgi:hypothetical protein